MFKRRSPTTPSHLTPGPGVGAAIGDLLSALTVHKEGRAQSIRDVINAKLIDEKGAELGAGRSSNRILAVQEAVMSSLDSNPECSQLRQDDVFMAYANKMSKIAARTLGWDALSLSKDQQLVETFIEILQQQYNLLKKQKVPPSIIKSHAYKFSPRQITAIIDKAEQLLGQNPETRSITRTVVCLVLAGREKSVEQAKAAYEAALVDAKKAFGTTGEMSLVRTTAMHLFTRKYRTGAEARQTFDALMGEARSRYYTSARSEPMIRAIVLSVYTKSVPTLEAAHAAYLKKEAQR